MKPLLVILGGLGFSMMTFIAGLIVATAFFNVGEDRNHLGGRDVANLWTNQPVRVDPAKNQFERLPAAESMTASSASSVRIASADPDMADEAMASIAQSGSGSQGEPDLMPTGTFPATEPVNESSEPEIINEAHMDWCSNRYRSYRPRDNSYTPFSGGRRECVSPFTSSSSADMAQSKEAVSPQPLGSDSFEEQVEARSEVDTEFEEASLRGQFSAEHIQSCFSRYRSYSPEDNSYQPYGGGPRQQCQ